MFQINYTYFEKINNGNHILAWKSKGSSGESIKAPALSNNSLAPWLNQINTKFWVTFDGSYLKQEKVTLTYKQVLNIYTAYQKKLWLFTVGKDFVLQNPLFVAVRLAKNTEFDKYKYSECDIGFYTCRSFSLSDVSGFGKNVIIFGADMSSSVHIDNKKKETLFVGKDPRDGLDDTTPTAEEKIYWTSKEILFRYIC